MSPRSPQHRAGSTDPSGQGWDEAVALTPRQVPLRTWIPTASWPCPTFLVHPGAEPGSQFRRHQLGAAAEQLQEQQPRRDPEPGPPARKGWGCLFPVLSCCGQSWREARVSHAAA